MNEIVYEALAGYYNVLKNTGYIEDWQSRRLLLLAFYKDFVFQDYRGILTKEDYSLIERALDCLYGSTCLIPYPDYLKMGKLHLSETTELANRVKVLEETEVIKMEDTIGGTLDSDIIIQAED